jgi:hypothetical protein
MAYTTIDDPSAHFQTLLYTGNGSNPRNLTNDGNSDLKPDLIWCKNRTDAGTDHILTNTTLGLDPPNTDSLLSTNSSGGVNTPNPTYGYVSAMLTDGFTAVAGGTNGDNFNANSKEFVAWQWKANGGTTSSNGDGSVTSTVQANTDAGFSIVTFTAPSSTGNITMGHGLGVKPDMVITKSRSGAYGWWTWHKDLTNQTTYYLGLNTASAETSESNMWGAGMTTSTFGMNSNASTVTDATYVAYCFAEKQGYSKFGSYTGNGDATNGPFVYLGFSPAWVMIKNTETAARPWYMFDNKRRTFNANGLFLRANTADAEATDQAIDMLSNGFVVRPDALGSFGTSSINHSGQKMVYMAFASSPFVSSTGIPTTAR